MSQKSETVDWSTLLNRALAITSARQRAAAVNRLQESMGVKMRREAGLPINFVAPVVFGPE